MQNSDLTGAARSMRFRYDLLTPDEDVVGTINGVVGGSLDWSAATTVRVGGTIDVLDVDGIDWLNARVRITRIVGDTEWARGIYVPSAPVEQWKDGQRSWAVELLGKLALLDKDKQTGWTTIPAGTVVTSTVRSMLLLAGHTRLRVTDSEAVTRSDMVWEPGTSLLRIVNDLLAAAGYWSLSADNDGALVAAPYVLPADRPPRHELLDDEHGLFVDDFPIEQDIYSIPNRIIIIGAGQETNAPLIGVAENVDPDSPYSIPARGMVITHREDGNEAASQALIDDYARRRLVELSSPLQSIEIKHAPIPLDLNDAIRFRRIPAGVDGLFTVQNMTEPLTPTDLVTTRLRKVVDL